MIKVIKHGHAQYKMICKYCECVFTFEDSDIEFVDIFFNDKFLSYAFCEEIPKKQSFHVAYW